MNSTDNPATIHRKAIPRLRTGKLRKAKAVAICGDSHHGNGIPIMEYINYWFVVGLGPGGLRFESGYP